MAEVQQCETENPGQNLPDLTRAAHRVHPLYVAGGGGGQSFCVYALSIMI